MASQDIISIFGASVRNLRLRAGISQEALAEVADLHRSYIANIEARGRNVTLKSVDKLARALRVSTAALLSHADGAGEGKAGQSNDEQTSGKSVDILLVEDNRDDIDLTLSAFKQARIANPVQVVQDGKEALDFLYCAGRFANRKMKDRPQLVLLDLNLPKVGGMDVLRCIKTDGRTKSIPVVVLTASRDSRELALCRRLGAETFIVKPVDFQGLSQATPRLKLDWALLKPPEGTNRSPRRTSPV